MYSIIKRDNSQKRETRESVLRMEECKRKGQRRRSEWV
jgi:hypothetical protein